MVVARYYEYTKCHSVIHYKILLCEFRLNLIKTTDGVSVGVLLWASVLPYPWAQSSQKEQSKHRCQPLKVPPPLPSWTDPERWDGQGNTEQWLVTRKQSYGQSICLWLGVSFPPKILDQLGIIELSALSEHQNHLESFSKHMWPGPTTELLLEKVWGATKNLHI